MTLTTVSNNTHMEINETSVNGTSVDDLIEIFLGDLIQWAEDSEIYYRIANYIIGIAGILLNILALVALLKQKGPLKLRFKLLVSLSVSNLVIALLGVVYFDFCWSQFDNCLRLYTVFEVDDSMPVVIVKYIINDAYIVAQYAGLATLFAISFDLLYAVRKPLYYYQSTGDRGCIIVCLLWAIPTGIQLGLSAISIYSKLGQGHDPRDSSMAQLFNALFNVISSLSVIAFIIIYCYIFCKLRLQFSTAPIAQTRSMKKIVCTILLIIGTYLACMIPNVWAFFVGVTILFNVRSVITVFQVLRLLYISNTLWSPIIYSVRVPEIKNEIKNMFKFAQCSNIVTFHRNSSTDTDRDITVTRL